MTALVDQVEAVLAPYAAHRARFLAEKVAAVIDPAPSGPPVVVETLPAGHTHVHRVTVRGDASPILVAAWQAAMVWHAWPGRSKAPKSVVESLDLLVNAFDPGGGSDG